MPSLICFLSLLYMFKLENWILRRMICNLDVDVRRVCAVCRGLVGGWTARVLRHGVARQGELGMVSGSASVSQTHFGANGGRLRLALAHPLAAVRHAPLLHANVSRLQLYQGQYVSEGKFPHCRRGDSRSSRLWSAAHCAILCKWPRGLRQGGANGTREMRRSWLESRLVSHLSYGT